MGLFRRREAELQPAPDETRSVRLPAYLSAGDWGFSTGGPQVASLDEALRDAATWACVKVKAQGIASLPIDVVRYDGKRRIQMSPPLVISKPSGIVTRRVWTFQAATSMFTDGNVFGLVQAVDAAAHPTQIELLDPAWVTQRKVVDGVTQVTVDGVKVHRLFPFGDLWHMPGEMVAAGSPFGLSPIWYGSRSTGTALAAEQFGGKFFTDGGHPSSVYYADTPLTREQARDIKTAILASHQGREPAVLGSGIRREVQQVNPDDSQFIELMRFEVEQTCRRHGVPPSMVYAAISGQNVTYANATQADLHFLKHTLLYPIDLLEDALSALLPAPRVVKYNREAILRGDTMTRYQSHEIALRNKWRTVNEVRAFEDEEPFGVEYDEPGVPVAAGGQQSLPFDDEGASA